MLLEVGVLNVSVVSRTGIVEENGTHLRDVRVSGICNRRYALSLNARPLAVCLPENFSSNDDAFYLFLHNVIAVTIVVAVAPAWFAARPAHSRPGVGSD